MHGTSADRHVGIFFLLALLIGAAGYVPLLLQSYGILPPEAAMFALLGGASPTIAAVLAAYRYEGRKGPARVFSAFKLRGFSAWWYVVSVFLPIAFYLGAIALSLNLGDNYNYADLNLLLLIPALISSLLLNMWEEVGWRGYALPKLQERHTALPSGAAIGVVWAAWHWPLFAMQGSQMLANYGNYSLFVIDTMLISIVYVWLYNSTNGSLLIASLFHAARNAAGIVLLMETGSVVDEILVLIVLAVMASLVLLLNPRDSLSRKQKAILAS